VLLAELGVEGDPDVLAHAVLAPMGAELYRHLRSTRGLGASELRAAVHALARGLTA
jgi:hypothetical protein